MTKPEPTSRTTSDPRMQTTHLIWGCAVAMFALCIPLSALNRGALILPVTVALGAGAGTVAVWRNGSNTRQRLDDEQTIRRLEERIANLEAIASHNDLEIQQQFRQLELKEHQE